MISPETPSSPVEEALLRSDIVELLQQHAAIVGIDQDLDDLDDPLEIVLGGALIDSLGTFDIQIWNYLDSEDGDTFDIAVEDLRFRLICDGVFDLSSETTMDEESVGLLRYWLSETAWDGVHSQALAATSYYAE